jgi:hypothetical protein
MIPFASVVAGGIGFVLIFFRQIAALTRRVFGAIFRRKRKTAENEPVVADEPPVEETKD